MMTPSPFAVLLLLAGLECISCQTLGWGKQKLQSFNGHLNGALSGSAAFEDDGDVTTHFFHGAVVVSQFVWYPMYYIFNIFFHAG